MANASHNLAVSSVYEYEIEVYEITKQSAVLIFDRVIRTKKPAKYTPYMRIDKGGVLREKTIQLIAAPQEYINSLKT